ncbi:amidohydrolase family protein [Actinobacteria bacterium YIM 96077]|uniref:Amidohydrolase family protein n=1 Tax=Phytoactinopolyspora halophila TaxID=1981511 RepID=A0A329QGC1_9ACTN|nr:amidohydrolase family protein [Phytoactinopolyspora halophila]AYY13585.1 amidohydrolase family protein [Actinobacteria bacterium YIM 96077]RAW10749.1 amidohydrolase family protein [Phytoactinopolyspora halophila]
MSGTQRPGADLTITNAAVFDGVSDQLHYADVYIHDGVIAEIGASGVTRAEQVIDARGRTLIPGMIDAHFHAYAWAMGGVELESRKLSYVALAAASRLGAALRRGFTTVRDVAGGDIGLAQALDDGLVAAPRYLYTGPALSQTGGHGDPRSPELDVCWCCGHMNELVDGADALRRAVRERFRTGAHAIKIMASGGVVSLSDPIRVPQYSAEEIAAVADEATRWGSYVAAHAYSAEAIVHAVGNGVRSVEHGNLLDAEAARVMAERDATLVPTLATYDAMNRRGGEVNLPAVSRAKNSEVLDTGKQAIEIARAHGVRIGFGTDLMGPLEGEQLHGIRLQLDVEPVENVLRALTSVNATLLGRSDIGRIAEGCAGDLVLLSGDPFAEPSVLWDEVRPRTVVQAGAVVA